MTLRSMTDDDLHGYRYHVSRGLRYCSLADGGVVCACQTGVTIRPLHFESMYSRL